MSDRGARAEQETFASADPGQKTTGTWRGPRTWPPAHVTSASSARRNSGIRSSQTSTATRISMRARFEPAQRWMPAPNATWRFWARSRITSSGCVEHLGVAVGAREVHQHLVAGLDRASGDLDVVGGDARHRDGGVGAQQFLDRERHDLGFVDQALARPAGCVARCSIAEPMPDQVVSTPAISVSAAMPMIDQVVDRLAVDLGCGAAR